MSNNVLTGLPRFNLSTKRRIFVALALYCLSALWALMFFQSIAAIFSSQKLVTSQVMIVVQAIAIPLAYFSLSIYCLIFALVAWRNLVATGLIVAAFVLGRPLNLLTLASGVIVLVALGLFYKLFFKNLDDLKRPRIAKAAQHSFAVFLMLMSVAISISFYQLYATRASRVSNSVSNVINGHFNAITAAISDVNSGETETFRSHTERYLRARNVPVTEAAIKNREKAVSTKLGVTARPDEPYQNFINRAINRQVALTLHNYKVLLVIIVPLAFFFVTQTFTSLASYVAFGLVFATELVLRKTGFLVQDEQGNKAGL